MEQRGRNVPIRSRGERPQRPQRIQKIQRRGINRQTPRQNRQRFQRRDRLERIRNNTNRNFNNENIRRFRRFNNFRRRVNIPRRSIYVGNLPFQINDDVLFRLFRVEGNIISARVVKDFVGKSKGFGFVEFQNPRDAFKSIKKWDNTVLGGKIIRVHFRRRRRFNNNTFNNRNNGRFAPRGRFGNRGQGRRFIPRGRQINRGRRY